MTNSNCSTRHPKVNLNAGNAIGNVSLSLILIAFAAILMMSIVPVLIKSIQVNEITIGLVRLAIATFGIGGYLLISRTPLKISREQLTWLLLLGVVFAVHWYLYFLSIRLTDASLAAIGVSTFGIHLLLLSVFIKKEKLSLIDFIAVGICLVGILLASPSASLTEQKLQGFYVSIGSGLLYACLPLINQKISSIPTNIRAFGQFGFALLCFSFFIPIADFELSGESWKGLWVLGIVSTLFAHTLWIKASTELSSNITAVIYYGYVPISLLLSYFFLGEPLTSNKLLGAALIIGANIIVILFHNKRNKH